MVKLGEYEIKKPKFIIFTDKDGTIDLEDKQLNNIFHLITAMGGMIIPITGRTIGDIESDFLKKKIDRPEIIIGDNGANIYHSRSGEFLIQKVLEHEKVLTIIEKFLEMGGNKHCIRFTNGSHIFASKDKEVREYYQKSNKVKFCNDIYQEMENREDITKVTLAGSKDLMQEITEFVKELDFWTDRDVTKFPKTEYQNYRLDISQRDINKGEAVAWLVEQLKPRFGYICVGNGYNDMSMFRTAIDQGMRVAIMENSPMGLMDEVKEYAKQKNKGKVNKIPLNKTLANRYILRMAKCLQACMLEQERKDKFSQRLPHVPRMKVKGIETKNIQCNAKRQTPNRDR